MESFEIPIGPNQRQLKIEQQPQAGTYKIFAVDAIEDWIEHGQSNMADIPADGLLGTITLRSEHDFDFEGAGVFSGDEVMGIAAQIVRHPSYQQQ
jgi:hypothetical protein